MGGGGEGGEVATGKRELRSDLNTARTSPGNSAPSGPLPDRTVRAKAAKVNDEQAAAAWTSIPRTRVYAAEPGLKPAGRL